jgi:hypothetical protein
MAAAVAALALSGHRYWAAVVLLTIAIQVLLLPLVIQQAHSVQVQRALRPELDRLHARYSKRPEQLDRARTGAVPPGAADHGDRRGRPRAVARRRTAHNCEEVYHVLAGRSEVVSDGVPHAFEAGDAVYNASIE